jgi:hypothetical protein
LFSAIPAAALDSNVVNIADNITAQIGNNINVPINIYNATGVASVGLKLNYNASVVNVTGAAQGDLTSFFGFDSSNASNGWVFINTFNIGPPLTGDLVVANITLKAVGGSGYTSQLHLSDIGITDQYGNNLPWTNNDGSFSIISQIPILDPIGDKSVNEGSRLKIIVSAIDPDGE